MRVGDRVRWKRKYYLEREDSVDWIIVGEDDVMIDRSWTGVIVEGPVPAGWSRFQAVKVQWDQGYAGWTEAALLESA